jgi:hypothetical protein
MPWAAGVYTRGYPSWSADAASNLPISATKFDTEDNDFAAGLNNCLTKDGLSTPNTPMTWGLSNGQVLNLTRGSDGVGFAVARTGGSNNPALQFTLADNTGVSLGFSGSAWMTFVQAGGVTFAQPVAFAAGSGVSGAFAGNANQYAITVTGSSTSGQSLGALIQAGTTSADFAFSVVNHANTAQLMAIFGDGHGTLGPSASLGLSWTAAGNMTAQNGGGGAVAFNVGLSTDTSNQLSVNSKGAGACAYIVNANGVQAVEFGFNNSGSTDSFGLTTGNAGIMTLTSTGSLIFGTASTPRMFIGPAGNASLSAAASGVTLAVSAGASADAAQFNINHASGNGIAFNDTNGSPQNFRVGLGIGDATPSFVIYDSTNAQIRFKIDASGNVIVPNGSGLSPVYAGIPQNLQVGATYQFVLADANKHVAQGAAGTHTYTIPANGTVAFPIGTAITIINEVGAGNLTLQITTDSLTWLPSGGTGTRTIAAGGMATILKITSTAWYMTGVGIS